MGLEKWGFSPHEMEPAPRERAPASGGSGDKVTASSEPSKGPETMSADDPGTPSPASSRICGYVW